MLKESHRRAARSMPAVRAVSLLMLLCALSVHATGTDKPVGKNCDLMSPPVTAGEMLSHGITLRIYPRARDIDMRYSGCQALFAPEGEKWTVLSLTEVIAGDPVRVWSSYEIDATVLACRFKQGKLVQGNPDTCPPPEFILVKSLAPGCARAVRDAVANHGPGTPWPPGCEFQ